MLSFVAKFPLAEFPPAPGSAPAEPPIPLLLAFPALLEPQGAFAEARLRLRRIPHKVRYCASHDASPSGSLPAIVLDGRSLAGRAMWDALAALEKDTAADASSSVAGGAAQHSDMAGAREADEFALMQLVRRLAAAVICHFYVVPANFGAVIDPILRRETAGPLAAYLSWSARQDAMDRLASSAGFRSVEAVLTETKVVLDALSNRLGASQFFFDDRISDVDLLLFAHLHAVLTSKAPDTRFPAIVPENLARLTKDCFELIRRDAKSDPPP